MFKKRVLPILLALTLIFSMAIPAFAKSWTGEYGGVDYTLTISKGVTTAAASFKYGATVQVRLLANAFIKQAGEKAVAVDHAEVYGAGKASASLTNGGNGSEAIVMVVATAYAGSDYVTSKSY